MPKGKPKFGRAVAVSLPLWAEERVNAIMKDKRWTRAFVVRMLVCEQLLADIPAKQREQVGYEY